MQIGSNPPIENSNVFSLVADATKSRVRKGLTLDCGENNSVKNNWYVVVNVLS